MKPFSLIFSLDVFFFHSVPQIKKIFRLLFSARVTGCCRIFPPKGLRGPNPVFLNGRRPGYILDESPAHHRTLTDGSGCLHKVPTAHQEQLWGSVSCSRILRHVAQSCPGELGFKPATFWSPVNQLYPLSYSRPKKIFSWKMCLFSLGSRDGQQRWKRVNFSSDDIRMKCLKI